MKRHFLTSALIAAPMLLIGTAAFAQSDTSVCMDARLKAVDQTACLNQMGAARTDADKEQVRANMKQKIDMSTETNNSGAQLRSQNMSRNAPATGSSSTTLDNSTRLNNPNAAPSTGGLLGRSPGTASPGTGSPN